jgi:hypothetical protein
VKDPAFRVMVISWLRCLERVLANVLPGAIADDQQFCGRRQRAASRLDERLSQHGGQRHGEFLPHRVLSFHRKSIGDTRNGGRGIGRMHGREHQMPGLGRRQRDGHRLGIAHLADDDDVGGLTQGCPQRRRKTRASIPISTCSITLRPCGCSYSIGSSTVTMCRECRALISATSAASVVVFPEPVGPQTRTRPAAVRPGT